jgi:hypothetical protein
MPKIKSLEAPQQITEARENLLRHDTDDACSFGLLYDESSGVSRIYVRHPSRDLNWEGAYGGRIFLSEIGHSLPDLKFHIDKLKTDLDKVLERARLSYRTPPLGPFPRLEDK